MTSQALSRLYTSSGDDVLINTLELESYIWLAQAYEDVTAVTEEGVQRTFSACALSVSLPPSDSEGTQAMQFSVCNIDGSVQKHIRKMADWYTGDQKSGSFPVIIWRGYLASDLSAPAAGPYEFYINTVACNSRSATITATYADVLNTSWPRGHYKSTDWPGLIYAS